MSKKKSYFIKTFGCQMNKADSEKIAGYYQRRGFSPAARVEEADETVINTCSVRQAAEDRVYGQIINLAKLKIQNSKLKIVLTGCMLRYPLRWLKEKMPQVDGFKRIKEFTRHSPAIRDSKTQAWVSIVEGCNNFCTYCVVPYARGRERSRPFTEIICEVKELVKHGYKEITLLGQNVNSYGRDFKSGQLSKIKHCFDDSNHDNANTEVSPFALLLHTLHGISGLKKIKFLTSNPWDLNDEIIEAMTLPKIDRYLHLPIQSGDDEILKRMNRKYTAREYLNLVQKIRRKIPEIEIGTDIIVGFPGEGEKQFQNTVDLCWKIGFKVAYIAMYSPRPQTVAYRLKDNVLLKEKKRRWQIIESLINKNLKISTTHEGYSKSLR